MFGTNLEWCFHLKNQKKKNINSVNHGLCVKTFRFFKKNENNNIVYFKITSLKNILCSLFKTQNEFQFLHRFPELFLNR